MSPLTLDLNNLNLITETEGGLGSDRKAPRSITKGGSDPMKIRCSQKETTLPEGTTVRECLKALDAFPVGTLAALKGGDLKSVV